jgi:hypothetical protein
MHVSIVWVEFRQSRSQGVNVVQIKLGSTQGTDDFQDIESPPALFDLQFFEGAKPLVGAANLCRRPGLPI